MELKHLVNEWFEKWRNGDFLNLPITEKFKHTSPFGIIAGKKKYILLVEQNEEKFLGNDSKIYDEIYAIDKACVRYKAIQGNFTLDVSEWYYVKDNLIEEIIAYYHIGEINDDRKLTIPDENY